MAIQNRSIIFLLLIIISAHSAKSQVLNNTRWRSFNTNGFFDKYWNFNNDTVATSGDNLLWIYVSVYSEVGNILTFRDLNSLNCNTADVGVYQFSIQLDTLRLSDVHEPCSSRLNYMEDHYFVDFPIGINEHELLKNVSVYPLPFSEALNIKSEGSTFEFLLYDISGRKVAWKSFSGFMSLNTEDIEPGMYLYELREDNQVVKSGIAMKH